MRRRSFLQATTLLATTPLLLGFAQPVEALVIRRHFPLPVTFSHLRETARRCCEVAPWWGKRIFHSFRSVSSVRDWWPRHLKEITGAQDEVFAVVGGREIKVATILKNPRTVPRGTSIVACGPLIPEPLMWALLEHARVEGYWRQPHEVRLDVLAVLPIPEGAPA